MVGAACGAPAPTQLTYHQNIKPIIDGRCVSCHQTDGIAPFALTHYAEVSAMAGAVKRAVVDRVMPPYLAGPDCNEYVDNQRLTDDEIARIVTWTETGLAEGTPAPEPRSLETAKPKGLARVDLKMEMPEAYSPRQSPDDYRCFVLDWKEEKKTFVVGMNVVPGNSKIVHHAIAFLIPPEGAEEYLKLDAAEPGPGYTCFGGAGGKARPGWLGAWAPGGGAAMYPPDTGIPVRPGSKVVLQVHYNTLASDGPVSDVTAIELALAPSVERNAALIPWANPNWLKPGGMVIPPYEANVTHTFSFAPSQALGWLSGGVLPSASRVRIWSAALHQHLLGKSGRIEIEKANGEKQCLLDVPRWDFHWQRGYGFSKEQVLEAADKLRITCTWDNSAEHQPFIDGQRGMPRQVEWGEGTTDEMCLGVLFVSE